MAKKAACRCKQAECEECPEWIFTFADLVMLMMGFFVILWVLKPGMPQPQDAKQANAAQTDNWLETVGEIRGGFGWEPDPKSSDPVDQVMIRKRMHGPGEKGKSMHTSKGAEGSDPEVTSIRPGKQASVGSRLLFEKADARLSAETSRLLDQIVLQIR